MKYCNIYHVTICCIGAPFDRDRDLDNDDLAGGDLFLYRPRWLYLGERDRDRDPAPVRVRGPAVGEFDLDQLRLWKVSNITYYLLKYFHIILFTYGEPKCHRKLFVTLNNMMGRRNLH